jgi:micrococcal nuclease
MRPCALIASLCGAALAVAVFISTPDAQARFVAVERVVDGDTLIVEDVGRVRLIGVDTPETVDPRRPVERFGREASEFLRRLVNGRSVRLEYDRERRDQYGRTLAYVFLPDGTFVNEEIIRQGYGFAYTRVPFKYLERFRGREREAREARRGLWAP